MNKIRIGIIGFGKIAADQHAPAIYASEEFELVGTSNIDGSGPTPSFSNWRELIQSVHLDAVAITTPPAARYEIARGCLEAGLHCLLEKPPTVGLSEINDLEGFARAEGRTLFCAWHSQHNAAVARAAEALVGQRIARMDVRWHEDVRKWHPGQRWLFEPGGFGVFDPAINAFSILISLFPGSVFVQAAHLLVPANAHTPVAAEIQLSSDLADGPMTCSFDFLREEGEEWTIDIQTVSGDRFQLADGGLTLLINNEKQQIALRPEYELVYSAFNQHIASGISCVDISPMRLVADCMMLAAKTAVEPIHI